jgi:hypothetical protein
MPGPELNVTVVAQISPKNATTGGYEFLTFFIDLGAKQGSIW